MPFATRLICSLIVGWSFCCFSAGAGEPSGTHSEGSGDKTTAVSDKPLGDKTGSKWRMRVSKSELRTRGINQIADLHSLEGEVHGRVVYEGQYPGGGSPHNYWYNPANGWIDIVVRKKQAPVILYLASYEYVNWRFDIEPGTKISAVFIQSYHPCTTSGLPNSVPIYMSCVEQLKNVPANTFVLTNDNGDPEYTGATQRITADQFVKKNLHRKLSSYEYEYKRGSFTI